MPLLLRSAAWLSAVIFLISSAFGTSAGQDTKLTLQNGWKLQSGCQINDTGDVISKASYLPKGWISTSVPATVLAAQVGAGQFKDIYVGMNLRKLPGMTYPVGLNSFANTPMDKDSPYACGWWYRTQFALTASAVKKKIALHFNGINYRANIWLNGKKVADAKDVAGAYHIQEFDVTSFVDSGKNTLAVEVFAPTEKDLGINWVDWNPTPPDKNMGLWGDVYLTTSGPVTVRYPQVVTHLPSESNDVAQLTVMADLQNTTDQVIEGVLEATLNNQTIKQTVKLNAGEMRTISFTPDQFPALVVKNPKLWWPTQIGQQNLHELSVRFMVGKEISDQQQIRYGIREITSELTAKGHRLFRVNHQPVLIRGGGWAQDMLLRQSPEKMRAQFAYVEGMNLNTIRLEAQLENEDFFNLADEKGILVMAGWCCCDIWEQWDKWQPGAINVATASLRSQLRRLRSHASMLAWLNGSDGPPPATVEQAYLAVEKETAWPNPVISSASSASTTVTGPSGVKMSGPYDYEPPSYWLMDKDKYGGAYGFNTETSPGPAIPVAESIKKFIPPTHLWPMNNEVWNYHAGGERFQNVDRFNEAMNATYGAPADFEDYIKKSQAMTYDGQRAMFEAYGRNKFTSTGVIQWMMNNAWPSLIWHLYDYYLQPAGGYFGTRKACEPLHVQYSYDDRSVAVVNGMQQAYKGLSVSATVFDFNLKKVFAQETKADVDANATNSVITLPAFPDEAASAVYFVKLTMADSSGRIVSHNFYWVPSKLSTLAWDKTPDTAWTPIATFEDMKDLNRLPAAKVEASAKLESNAVRVKLRNPSDKLAFQVRLSVLGGAKAGEILPVLWDDNYVSLMPGETREVEAHYVPPTQLPATPVLRVEGWNVEPVNIALQGTRKASAHE